MERTLDDRQRWEEAAGEDVGLDPVGAAALRLVGDVRKGDRLEAHPPARHEGAVAGLEERREVLRADSLEHLDRDDRVVRPGDLAVVAQLDAHAIRQPGGGNPLSGERVLRRRDRDRRHAAAELAGRIQGEAAPAGADLEHVLARRAARRRAAMTAYLLRWASASAWSGVGKDRARVRHGLVEEQAVEVVAEVVVRRDVAAAPGRACSAAPDAPGSAAAGAAVATSRRRAPAPRD